MTNQPKTGVLFLRHGETFANNKPHIIGGRTNETRLVPLGHTQTWRVGQLMRAFNIIPAKVHSSIAVRTIQSAGNALDGMGSDLDVFTHPELQELDQGEWTGLLRAEVYTDEVRAQMQERGMDFKGPGAESMNEVGERIASWVLDTIPMEPTTDTPGTELYLVSAHGVATRSYVARQERWTHAEVMARPLGNASLTLMLPREGEWRLAAFDAAPDAIARELAAV